MVSRSSPSEVRKAIGDPVQAATAAKAATMPPFVAFREPPSYQQQQPSYPLAHRMVPSTFAPIARREPESHPVLQGSKNHGASTAKESWQGVDLRGQVRALGMAQQELAPHPGPPAATRLQRHQSEPVNASQSKRRAIFDRYWKQEERYDSSWSSQSYQTLYSQSVSSQQAPASKQRRYRARSSSAPEGFSSFWDMSICDFSPPQRSSFVRQREHYSSVRWDRLLSFPEEGVEASVDESGLVQQPPLPPLPVPLQRFYSEGRGTTLPGMYPLVRAHPALRRSSYLNETASSSSVNGLEGAASPTKDDQFSFPRMANGLNLTRSVSQFRKSAACEKLPSQGEEDEDDEDVTTEATASSTSISTTATASRNNVLRRGVSFDPRITVTEFEDAHPRVWFSDADLERFRMETVLVAQKYLLKHPEMIELYNKPVLDPVTGTMRKKALFSMPALRAGDDSSSRSSSSSDKNSVREDALSPTLTRRRGGDMKELAYRNVKCILVADRNNIILDLFRRSLRNVFPHARITTAQSGEEALRYFEEAWSSSSRHPGRPFDIVIVEDRLDQPLTSTGTPVLSSGKSLSLGPCSSGDAGLNKVAEPASGNFSLPAARTGPHHVRHDSLLSLSSQRRSMTQGSTGGYSGSDLLRKISSSYCRRTEVDAPKHGTSGLLPSPNPSPPSSTDVPQMDAPAASRGVNQAAAAACLLIGVSVQPDKERAAFRSAGADAVWGKPPPRMDDRLRDELVTLLVRKREGGPGH